MTADFDPADFDGDSALDTDMAGFDIDPKLRPVRHLPLLVQASGRYNFVRSPRFPMPRALPGAVDRFDDDINALTLYTREELRLDVDGRYPQMTVSGTRAGPLGPVVSWVAALTRTCLLYTSPSPRDS